MRAPLRSVARTLVAGSLIASSSTFGLTSSAVFIKSMHSYSEHMDGLVLVVPSETVPECEGGFYYNRASLGFASLHSNVLLAHVMRQRVIFEGDPTNRLPGSTDTCYLTALKPD